MTARRYHFDHWGKCLGYVDEDGQYYDKGGRCRGRVVKGRDFYDTLGVYRGHFDIQGQYWDEHGRYGGYLRAPIEFASPRCPPKGRDPAGTAPALGAKSSNKRSRAAIKRAG